MTQILQGPSRPWRIYPESHEQRCSLTERDVSIAPKQQRGGAAARLGAALLVGGEGSGRTFLFFVSRLSA